MKNEAFILTTAALAVTAVAAAATRPVETPATQRVQPSTRSTPATGDPALDFLLSTAATQPVKKDTGGSDPAGPASRPANPFAKGHAPAEARIGTLLLSNGEKIRGTFATTQGSPLRVWVEKEKAYRDVSFASIASAEAKVLWEREEREWRFKESGSDIKEYSGRTYPARELEYTITLKDGKTVRGSVVAPIYLQTKDGYRTYVLNKRLKGEAGESLKDLTYLARLQLE